MLRMKIGNLKVQNYKTLDALKSELAVRQERKVDAVVPFNRLRYIPGQVALRDDDGNVRAFNPTLTGWKQVLREAEIPADFFLEKMTVSEQETIFNRLVSLNEGLRMLRLDGNTLYGCVSEKYRAIDNAVVADVAQSSDVPLILANRTMSYDHSKFRFVPACYADMEVHRGTHLPTVEIINSENGLGSFRIVAGVFSVICANGLVVPVGDFIKTRFYHKGDKEVKFPDLGQVLNYSQMLVDKMYKAEKIYMSADAKVRVINRAVNAGLSHETINNIISIANAHYRNGRTLADTVGAFTQTAQMYIDADAVKRTAIEEFAGGLLLAA